MILLRGTLYTVYCRVRVHNGWLIAVEPICIQASHFPLLKKITLARVLAL